MSFTLSVFIAGTGIEDITKTGKEVWSSPDKTDSQLSDHGHFFVFLRAIIPYRRM
jgi:hypothetical protein